jgi:hypothetical protein
VSCHENNTKIYIKRAPTRFGVTITPSSGNAFICAQIIALPDDGITVTPKHFGAVLM